MILFLRVDECVRYDLVIFVAVKHVVYMNPVIIIFVSTPFKRGPNAGNRYYSIPFILSVSRTSREGKYILLIEFELRRINVFSVATGDGISRVRSADNRLEDLEYVSSALGGWGYTHPPA